MTLGFRQTKDRLLSLSVRDLVTQMGCALLFCMLLQFFRHVVFDRLPLSLDLVRHYDGYVAVDVILILCLALLSLIVSGERTADQFVWSLALVIVAASVTIVTSSLLGNGANDDPQLQVCSGRASTCTISWRPLSLVMIASLSPAVNLFAKQLKS